MTIFNGTHEQVFNNSASELILSFVGRIVSLSNAAYASGFESRERLDAAYADQHEYLVVRGLGPRSSRCGAIALTSLVAVVTVISFLWSATPQAVRWASAKLAELRLADFSSLADDASEWASAKARIQSGRVSAWVRRRNSPAVRGCETRPTGCAETTSTPEALR